MYEKKIAIEAFESLENIELTLSEIYQTFGEMFPGHKDFWANMAEDERAHAAWVRRMYAMYAGIKESPLSINRDRFQNRALRIFQEELEETHLEIRKKPLSLIQAVKLAVDLEGSLIERKFYEILEGDPNLLKGFFAEMKEQVLAHVKRLVSVLAELRKTQSPKTKTATTSPG